MKATAPKKTNPKKTTLEDLSVNKKKKEVKAAPEKEKPVKEAPVEKEVVDASAGSSQAAEQSEPTEEKETSTEAETTTEEKDSETAPVPEVATEPEISEERVEPPLEKHDKKLFAFGLMIFVLTVLATSGVFIFFLQSDKNVKKEVAVVEEKTTPTPTPTPATLKREEWSIEVLNGSGVSGAAKRIADKLEALGYVIKSTGNAETSNYETTEISVSSSKESSDATLFLADMKKELGVGTSSGDLTDNTADAQIIVGTDNSE